MFFRNVVHRQTNKPADMTTYTGAYTRVRWWLQWLCCDTNNWIHDNIYQHCEIVIYPTIFFEMQTRAGAFLSILSMFLGLCMFVDLRATSYLLVNGRSTKMRWKTKMFRIMITARYCGRLPGCQPQHNGQRWPMPVPHPSWTIPMDWTPSTDKMVRDYHWYLKTQ